MKNRYAFEGILWNRASWNSGIPGSWDSVSMKCGILKGCGFGVASLMLYGYTLLINIESTKGHQTFTKGSSADLTYRTDIF